MKNRLRELRAERDWTQSRLASELDVSRQNINAIENEKYDPSLTLAFRIAHLFGQTVEQIFTPDEGRSGLEEDIEHPDDDRDPQHEQGEDRAPDRLPDIPEA